MKTRRSKSSMTNRKITKAELALFIRRLGTIYDNARFGNKELANALYELADSLAEHAHHPQELPFPESSQKLPDTPELKTLSGEAVARFVVDETKTKRELIELAVTRFSIPRSGLMRMKTADVREAIQTALLHENSISIIAQEARRSGADRKS
jgi:hypothetical protein